MQLSRGFEISSIIAIAIICKSESCATSEGREIKNHIQFAGQRNALRDATYAQCAYLDSKISGFNA